MSTDIEMNFAEVIEFFESLPDQCSTPENLSPYFDEKAKAIEEALKQFHAGLHDMGRYLEWKFGDLKGFTGDAGALKNDPSLLAVYKDMLSDTFVPPLHPEAFTFYLMAGELFYGLIKPEIVHFETLIKMDIAVTKLMTIVFELNVKGFKDIVERDKKRRGPTTKKEMRAEMYGDAQEIADELWSRHPDWGKSAVAKEIEKITGERFNTVRQKIKKNT
jgi:hypothetical protein